MLLNCSVDNLICWEYPLVDERIICLSCFFTARAHQEKDYFATHSLVKQHGVVCVVDSNAYLKKQLRQPLIIHVVAHVSITQCSVYIFLRFLRFRFISAVPCLR